MASTSATSTAATASTASIPASSCPPPDYDTALAVRRRHYGPNTSLSYERPIMFVRGAGAYLYDQEGVSYLDCVNNVSHLGHGHAEVRWPGVEGHRDRGFWGHD